MLRDLKFPANTGLVGGMCASVHEEWYVQHNWSSRGVAGRDSEESLFYVLCILALKYYRPLLIILMIDLFANTLQFKLFEYLSGLKVLL